METVKLNNGVEIPVVGLGVFLSEDGEETVNAVKWAIEAGYRHIDTAAAYRNEESVREGIKASGVDRKEIFITTKMTTDDIYDGNYDNAIANSLNKLGTDYVDLYLLHWPMGAEKNKGAWQALERFYEEGKIRAIGVSNYTIEDLEDLLSYAKVVPAMNQIEEHPDLNQKELIDYCESKGIKCEAWSPLGGSRKGAPVLQNKTIVEMAEKYGKSPAQIIIRWNVQRGVVVIPKSVHQNRIVENYSVFDFEISEEDMNLLNSIDENARVGKDPKEYLQMYLSRREGKQ